MRGGRFCWAHRHDAGESPAVGSESEIDVLGRQPSERALRSERFAEHVRAGRQDELVERAVAAVLTAIGGELSLGQEIGALRLMLHRVIAMDALDGDPRDTAATIARLVDGIVRAVRAQRAISGELADDLSAALTTVLIEMGLGEEA
jgi:hypothetical protein